MGEGTFENDQELVLERAKKEVRHLNAGRYRDIDVDDLAMQVLDKVWRRISDEEPDPEVRRRRLLRWTKKAAYTTFVDWRREVERSREIPLPDGSWPDAAPAAAVVASPSLDVANNEQVDLMLELLTSRERELVAAKTKGLSSKEIAEQLGYKNDKTVNTTWFKLQRRLRDEIGEDRVNLALAHLR